MLFIIAASLFDKVPNDFIESGKKVCAEEGVQESQQWPLLLSDMKVRQPD